MAGSLVGALRVTLGIDTAAFEEGLGIAQKRLAAAGKRMQEAGQTISGVGKTISTVMAPVAIAIGAAAAKGLEYASSLGEVAQQLGVTTDELQEYRYAASQAGIAQDEMDKALGKLTQSIGKAAQGTGPAADAFGRLGINIRDAEGNIKSTGTLLPEIAEALSQIPDPASRAALQVALFGKAGQKLETLLSGGREGIDALRKAAQDLGIVLSSGDIASADDAADKLAALQQVLTAKIGSVVAQNADTIVAAATAIAGAITPILDAFGRLSPGAQQFALAATAIAVAVGPVLVVIGTLVSSIGALIPVFAPLVALIGAGGLGAAFTALAAAIAPFIAPIAAVAAIGALIYANWDKIGPVIEEFRAKVFGALGPKLQSLIETVKTTLTKLWNGPFGDAIRVVIGVLGEMQAAYLSVLGEVIIRVVSALISFLDAQFRIIGDIFNIVIALLSGDFAGAWEAMKSLVSNVITGVINILNSLAPGAGEAVAEMAAGFRQWFADLATRMVTYGRAIIDGLVFGINAAPQAVWNALRNVVLRGVENVREMLGIASPSKLFISFGGFVTEGLAIGITGGLPKVKAAMDKLGSTVADGLAALPAGQGISIDPGAEVGAASEDASSALRDTFRQTFADGIKAALSGDLGSFLDQTFNSIFDNVLRNFSDGLAGALSGLLGGGGGGGGLGDLFGSVVGSIFGGAPGFALGGSFKVGGRPGRDANLVAFRATRGETVEVSTSDAAQANSGGMGLGISAAPVVNITNNIDASGADPAAIARLNTKLDQMNAELPGKIVRTVQDASDRRVIKVGGRG